MSESGAYVGVRIIELASGISGPYATRFLADQGADVIKVEDRLGDPYRKNPGFHALNRNKRSVVVTNKEPLIRSGDVVVVDDIAEVDFVRSIAPGAIIISMPIWGSVPTSRGVWGSGEHVSATTGIAWNQVSWTEGPVQVVLPLSQYGAGMLGALAIAAGLYAREVHGSAPHYEVSEIAGSGAMQIGDFWLPGTPQERDGASPLGPAGRAPAYRPFQAADEEWLFVACGTRRFFEAMLRAIGRMDLLGSPDLPNPPWGLIEPEPLALITPVLEEAFREKDRASWIEVLRTHDVPCQPIQSREEFVTSELAASNKVMDSIEHPELGVLGMPSQPLHLEECPSAPMRRAPEIGENTEAVLKEKHEPGTGAGQGGPPLKGTRAIDLASFIAGPVITRHLAMLGSDVIKVESPDADPFRDFSPHFNGWNQGKRGIALDLKRVEDKEFFYKLVEAADVVVENFRPGVAERLGCSTQELRAARDDLVLVKSPGYGADVSRADQPAFDPLLQALGGMMVAQGGDGEPVFLTVPVHDAATPIIAAFGTVTALYHRSICGKAQTVHTSLAQTTAAAQVAEFVSYEGREKPAIGGFDYKGPEQAQRYLEENGEWVWSDHEGKSVVERNGFACSPLAIANDLVCQHQDSPGWGPIHQVGQLIRGAGSHPERAPYLNEHEAELHLEFD